MCHESPKATTDVAPPPSDQWLVAAEAAQLLRVHVSTVYRLTQSGALASERFGVGEKRPRGLRIHRSSVEALLNEPVGASS